MARRRRIRRRRNPCHHARRNPGIGTLLLLGGLGVGAYYLYKKSLASIVGKTIAATDTYPEVTTAAATAPAVTAPTQTTTSQDSTLTPAAATATETGGTAGQASGGTSQKESVQGLYFY